MIFPSFNISVKMIFSIAYFDEQPIETPFLLISIITNWGKGGGENWSTMLPSSRKLFAIFH